MTLPLRHPALRVLPDDRRWPMTSRERRVFVSAYADYQKWSALARESLEPSLLNAMRTKRRIKKSVAAYRRMMNCLHKAKTSRGIPTNVRLEARLDLQPPSWAVEGSVR